MLTNVPVRTIFQTSQLPVFGICLGHQLVALAAGARTTKLKVSTVVNYNIMNAEIGCSTETVPTIFLALT